MAARSQMKDLQEALLCPVCLDYFKDPVILKCLHNFCRACITRVSEDAKSAPSNTCPQCRAPFRTEDFQPNMHLRNVAEIAKKFPDPKAQRLCGKHEEFLKLFCEVDQAPICLVCRESRDHKQHSVVPVDEAAQDYKGQIQSRLKNLKKQREEILSYKSSEEKKSQELLKQLETDKQKIVSEFERLSKFLKEQEQLLLGQLEEMKKEIEKRRDEYVAKLSNELSLFSSLISEMEQKCQQPAIELLQDITGTLRRCEREKFQNPVVFSSELKWEVWESSQRNGSLDVVMKTFRDSLASGQQLSKADVTLDPDTAHPWLVLSEDRRRVRWERRREPPPDTPERFDTELCVLGREGFTSGRHYWEVEVEVEVEQRGLWAVGVARESVRRKGWVNFIPDQGVWAVTGRGDQCWARTGRVQYIHSTRGRAPRRVRVCLDYEGGRVAFYDAGSGESIFTFPPAPFAGERIRPILRCLGYEISLCTRPPSSLCAPELPPPPPGNRLLSPPPSLSL